MREVVFASALSALLFTATLAIGLWMLHPAPYSMVGWSSLLLLSYYVGTIAFLAQRWSALILSKRLLLVIGLLLSWAALLFSLRDNPSSSWILITISAVLFGVALFKNRSFIPLTADSKASPWHDSLISNWITEFDRLLLLDLPHELRAGIVNCLHRLTTSAIPDSQFMPAEDEKLNELGKEISYAIQNRWSIDRTKQLIQRFDETLVRRNQLIIKTSSEDFLIAHKTTQQLLSQAENNVPKTPK